ESRPCLGREAPERQTFDLTLQGFDVVRMAVSDAADADAGDEVDVLLAILVVEHGTRAARHRDPGVLREGLKPWSHVAPFLLDDLFGSRTGLAQLHHATPRKRMFR